jgi:HPt (histidine-containing phosphotransfer) domain-containing protein
MAVKNNDLKELREQVHKLHGASRCCGTTELKKTSSHIENLIHQNISFDIEKETLPLFIAIKNVADYKITEAPPAHRSNIGQNP